MAGEPMRESSKDSVRLGKRCTKLDKKKVSKNCLFYIKIACIAAYGNA